MQRFVITARSAETDATHKKSVGWQEKLSSKVIDLYNTGYE